MPAGHIPQSSRAIFQRVLLSLTDNTHQSYATEYWLYSVICYSPSHIMVTNHILQITGAVFQGVLLSLTDRDPMSQITRAVFPGVFLLVQITLTHHIPHITKAILCYGLF